MRHFKSSVGSQFLEDCGGSSMGLLERSNTWLVNEQFSWRAYASQLLRVESKTVIGTFLLAQGTSFLGLDNHLTTWLVKGKFHLPKEANSALCHRPMWPLNPRKTCWARQISEPKRVMGEVWPPIQKHKGVKFWWVLGLGLYSEKNQARAAMS